MDTFKRIQELRDAYESALDDAERMRDEYHRAIVKLHRSGMSLRDIAEGLGISHQRVHQIVSPLEEKPAASKGRRASVGGAVAALVLIVATGVALFHGGRDRVPVASPSSNGPPAAVCLQSATGALTRYSPCYRAVYPPGAVVVIDPETGKILAITTGFAGTDRFVVRVDCGNVSALSGCLRWAGQDSNPRHEG